MNVVRKVGQKDTWEERIQCNGNLFEGKEF